MGHFVSFIARRYLWAQRRNFSSGLIALFSTLGVMIGTWLLIFVLSASNGFEMEVKNQLMGKDAHFEVTHAYGVPIEDSVGLLKSVQNFPDVKGASPYIVSQAVFARKKQFQGGVVFGIDADKSLDVITLKNHILRGNYAFDSLMDSKGKFQDGVIMGYALANRLGLQIGDKCLLYVFEEGKSLTGGLMPKMKAFVLAAVFETGMYEFDQSLAYISLKAAQKAFNMQGKITGVHGKVDKPFLSHEISDNLEGHLGYPYSVIDWQEKNRTLIKWMSIEKILIGLALMIIIIIAAFNIISSLVMNVNDKTREIGILRAMGAKRRDILWIFITEGLFIGLIGTAAGLFMGLGSCWVQEKFGLITLPGDVYFVTKLPVQPQIMDIVLVVVITNVLCIIAGIIPALQAALKNPVDAIRYE